MYICVFSIRSYKDIYDIHGPGLSNIYKLRETDIKCQGRLISSLPVPIMAAACERLDELVKDYLLYRGFTATVKIFDHEMKHDKDKGLRVRICLF